MDELALFPFSWSGRNRKIPPGHEGKLPHLATNAQKLKCLCLCLFKYVPPLSLDKSFVSLNKLMLAEKGSPGCTGCPLQLILHALPVWLGINLFNSLLSAWKTYSSKKVVPCLLQFLRISRTTVGCTCTVCVPHFMVCLLPLSHLNKSFRQTARNWRS